jgi:hypothetical protein
MCNAYSLDQVSHLHCYYILYMYIHVVTPVIGSTFCITCTCSYSVGVTSVIGSTFCITCTCSYKVGVTPLPITGVTPTL